MKTVRAKIVTVTWAGNVAATEHKEVYEREYFVAVTLTGPKDEIILLIDYGGDNGVEITWQRDQTLEIDNKRMVEIARDLMALGVKGATTKWAGKVIRLTVDE